MKRMPGSAYQAASFTRSESGQERLGVRGRSLLGLAPISAARSVAPSFVPQGFNRLQICGPLSWIEAEE